jgi:hypothetical protein
LPRLARNDTKRRKQIFSIFLLDNLLKVVIFFFREQMEEIEIMSWLTLDAIKSAAEVKETVGDLHIGHCKSVFCKIEDDMLELCYSDSTSNYIRRYENKEEFETALAKRKEEEGEAQYEENPGYDDEDFADNGEEEEDLEIDDEPENI